MSAAKKSLASRAGSIVRRAVSRGGESTTVEPSDKAPATKAPAEKAPAKKAPAKKAPAKKAAAKRAPAKKASAAKPAAATKGTATNANKKTATKTATKKTARRGSAAALVVREDESPWTAAELTEVRKHLRADVSRLEPELEHADAGLHDLMIDSGDGSGQDQADMGSSTFERDHELSIANNAREMLDQSRHALQRIDDGTFGVCEGCGEPIGKLRLIAFPRATLCMTCKQREERR